MRQNAIFARGLNMIGLFKPIIENISLFQKIKSGVWSAHPAAARGAYRDRHGRRQRDAMDAGHFTRRVWLPRTAKARGPDLPTLGSSLAVSRCRPYRADTLRSARRRWLKSPVHRGERADRPLTPIAQGRPECFGGPVVTNACAFYPRTRGYGCAKHPAFPAPFLISEGRALQDSGRSCRGNAQSHPLRCRAPA